MSVQSKAERLFEFISQVYSIDLPTNRDVTKYGMELWWQADILQSQQCKIKEFDEGKGDLEKPDSSDTASEDLWLSVAKRSYDNPPQLPPILEEWINLSSNPTMRPSAKPLLLKAVPFDADEWLKGKRRFKSIFRYRPSPGHLKTSPLERRKDDRRNTF